MTCLVSMQVAEVKARQAALELEIMQAATEEKLRKLDEKALDTDAVQVWELLMLYCSLSFRNCIP